MSPDQRSCTEVGRTLLLLAGELPEPDTEAAHEHLEACAICGTLRKELTEVENAYARLPDVVLPEAEKQKMLATATREGRAADQSIRGVPRPLMAAAAAAVLFVAGLATGVLITRPQTGSESPVAVSAPDSAVRIAARDPVQRARFVANLGKTGMTAATVSELVSLLQVEPNPNVRLAITDALRAATMAREDQRRLLELLSTEPVAALRIEILELAVQQGAPGLDSVLVRVAHVDDAATVRRFADRTLGALEGQL